MTLINQFVMVAADVDNDLFQQSMPSDSDGSLMASLSCRIAALYSGTDQVLGASAGLKHFGARRLGRSGLYDRATVWDNVFHRDVTGYLTAGSIKESAHSAVFESPKALELVASILRGVDGALLPNQLGLLFTCAKCRTEFASRIVWLLLIVDRVSSILPFCRPELGARAVDAEYRNVRPQCG